MAARVLEVADAVVDYIRANMDDRGVTAVERRVPPDVLEEKAFYENLVGRWVFVLPTRHRFGENRTRGRRAHVYELSVITAERVPTDYRNEPERRAWSDGVLEWIENTIHLPLTDEENLVLIAGAALYPTEAAGLLNLIEPSLWSQLHLLWSEVQLAFWEG